MTTRNEYESFKGLLSAKQVNTLDRNTLLSCVAEKTKLDLGSSQHVYLLHDPCYIRKPHSSDLEDLGTVLSLQKTVINGYSSFNSVAITPDSQEIPLLDSFVYSNSQQNYVSQSDVALIEKEGGKTQELTSKKGKLISLEKQDYLPSLGYFYILVTFLLYLPYISLAQDKESTLQSCAIFLSNR